MKLFKLTKTLDYINHPIHEELIKISHAVTDSMASLRDMLVSAFLSTLFSLVFINRGIICRIRGVLSPYILSIDTELLSLLLYSISAFGFYYVLKIVRHLINERKSNKDTFKKREALARKFYSLAVPQLIEARSIMELIEEKYAICINLSDERIKKLLLHQAKHGICVLISCLKELNIVDQREQRKIRRIKIKTHSAKQKIHSSDTNKNSTTNNKNKNTSPSIGEDSQNVLQLIGQDSYSTFLIEMLNTFKRIFLVLSQYNDPVLNEDLATFYKLIIKNDYLFVDLNEVKNVYYSTCDIIKTVCSKKGIKLSEQIVIL